MSRKAKSLELRAGLFLNLVLVLAILAIFLLGGGGGLFHKRARFNFTLANARGLISGAKVLVSGVQAGKVESLAVEPSTGKVKVTIAIAHEYLASIRNNSIVDITPEGVLGDKVVSISSGTPDAPPAREGSILMSNETGGFEQLIAKTDRLLDSLNRAVESIDRITGLIDKSGKGKEITKTLAELLTHLNELAQKANQGFDSDSLHGSLVRLNRILEKIDAGKGTLGALVNDPQVYDDVKRLMGQANQNRILRNLVRKNIEESEQAGQVPPPH